MKISGMPEAVGKVAFGSSIWYIQNIIMQHIGNLMFDSKTRSKIHIHTQICKSEEHYMRSIVIPAYANDALRQHNIKILNELSADLDVRPATRQRAANLAELLPCYDETKSAAGVREAHTPAPIKPPATFSSASAQKKVF